MVFYHFQKSVCHILSWQLVMGGLQSLRGWGCFVLNTATAASLALGNLRLARSVILFPLYSYFESSRREAYVSLHQLRRCYLVKHDKVMCLCGKRGNLNLCSSCLRPAFFVLHDVLKISMIHTVKFHSCRYACVHATLLLLELVLLYY